MACQGCAERRKKIVAAAKAAKAKTLEVSTQATLFVVSGGKRTK
jgi:hypothetical protein